MNLRKALAENHAKQVLLRLVDTYPELANELRALIESELPRATPGFRSRGEKVLRALARIDLGKEGARTKKRPRRRSTQPEKATILGYLFLSITKVRRQCKFGISLR